MYLPSMKTKLLKLWIAVVLLLPIVPLHGVSAKTIVVTAHGAHGSGEADDTAAIQIAIDAASKGDTVLIPAGTYYLSNTLKGKSGVTIKGVNRDHTIIKYMGTSDIHMFHFQNVTDAKITNMTLDGNDSPILMSAVYADHSTGITMSRLRVKDLAASEGFGPHALFADASQNTVIRDNIVTNIGMDSIWGAAVRAGWNSNGTQVLNNKIENTGRGGIFANDGCNNVVVRGNEISGSGLREHGLSIELHTNCNYSVIEDNQVDHWISAVRSSYVAVRDNVVRPEDDRVKGIGLEIMVDHGITTGNLVDGGQQVGMQQSPGTGYQYWGYNTIQNMVMWGMQLQGAGTGAMEQFQYFYKNIFRDNAIGHPKAAYPGYEGNGIRIHGNAQNLTFDSNEVNHNGRKGIEFTGAEGVDRLSFINNVITGNGIAVDPYPADAEHLEWFGNTVEDNGTNTEPTSRGFSSPKPTAGFTAPSEVVMGTPVKFTNTSTDHGTIVENLWDFGEGVPNTSVSPTYVYQNPGEYRVTLVVWDNEGRASLTEHMITVKDGRADREAPSSPTNLASPSQTDDSIDLVWTASTDNVGVVAYGVFVNNEPVGTTSPGETSFTVRGLAASTTYSFTITAKDFANHISVASNALSVSTEAPDSTPPSAPADLIAASQTESSVELIWSASTDNKAVAGYEVYRDGNLVGATTGADVTSFTAAGLAPGATYTFTVKAKDAEGNLSEASNAVSVTMAPPSEVTYISDLTWTMATNGWGAIQIDKSIDGKPITLNGVTYDKGLGVHAVSEITYDLKGVFHRFQSDVGVDDETYNNGAVGFEIWLDGVMAYDSGVMDALAETKSIDLDITDVQQLKLVVNNGDNGLDWDHADWADTRLIYSPAP
jgi:chitodextrinase